MAKRKLVLKNSEKDIYTSYHSIDMRDSHIACVADHPQHVKTVVARGNSYFSAYATVIDKVTLLDDSKADICCAAKINSLVLYDRSNMRPTCATIKNIHMYMNSSGVIEQDLDDRPIKVNTIHMYGNSNLVLYENAEVDCIYLHSFSRLRLENNAHVKRVVMSGGSHIYSLRGGRIDTLIMRDNSDGHVEQLTIGCVKIGKNADLETCNCSFKNVVSSGRIILENVKKQIDLIGVYGGFTSLCYDADTDTDDELPDVPCVKRIRAVAGKFYLEDHIVTVDKLSVSKNCEFDGGAGLDEYVNSLRWHGKPMDPLHWVISDDV